MVLIMLYGIYSIKHYFSRIMSQLQKAPKCDFEFQFILNKNAFYDFNSINLINGILVTILFPFQNKFVLVCRKLYFFLSKINSFLCVVIIAILTVVLL